LLRSCCCMPLRRSAVAATRLSAVPLPLRCSAAAPCEAAAAFGSLPVLLATWIFAPPQAGEKDERCFEKRNLCSRVPRLRFHVEVVWSRAKSCAVLGGTLGENADWCSGHGSSTQADGCGLSPAAGPARYVVLCGHRRVFSSPPGRRNVSPPRIFSTNPHTLGELGGVLSLLPVNPSQCPFVQMTDTDVAFLIYYRSCPCDRHDLYLPPSLPLSRPWAGVSAQRPVRSPLMV